jgi:hypothetical protein
LPPEKILPKDTILVVTAPDSRAAWQLLTNSPYGRLWQDPQIKPFKDKFVQKFSSDVITPLERNLGVKLSDYSGLAQGQATFALLPLSQPDKPQPRFGRIFLLDTGDRAAQLRDNLAAIRQKWAAAGKPMKLQKIRGIDFTTLMVSAADISWGKLVGAPDAAAPEDGAPTNSAEITFGQADSLLLVSDSVQAIDQVLSRQQGGYLPPLAEQPAFQADYAGHLRGASFYAWVNVKDPIDLLTKAPPPNDDSPDPGSAFRPDSLLSAAGATAVTSACFSYRGLPEGLIGQFFVGVPESKRHGLLKAFASEAEDSDPPPFVPADVTKFWRWRINIPHAWAQIETTLNDFNPQYASVINFILQTAGKDKDEHYDLKSELLSSLGDDIIHYEKAPEGNTLADLNSAPSIYLIGSPNPDKLAAALKTGLGFLGTATDREFLGRKITTLTAMGQNGAPGRSFSFAASGSYVAFSGDTEIVEEFLRSNESKAPALRDTPGLADAAQRVGGMSTGLFGFENQNVSMRALIQVLREQPVTLQDILGSARGLPPGTADDVAKLRTLADFSLLPPFDAISQYFYFSVYSGSFSPEGFTMKFFAPTPPKLR